jgi:hypothetical protein
MKLVLVDCFTYRGLPASRRRHAAPLSDRDELITTGMKRLSGSIRLHNSSGMIQDGCWPFPAGAVNHRMITFIP